ncbi:hypothetical protein LCGC14_0601930 [marine sediment metagenome]|uniref:Phage head morphogenesis domain-containing protein n=1 Tax=marine sediment metagenome TaxID=412755 RepID=A0A0F9TWE4_9ZZZZ
MIAQMINSIRFTAGLDPLDSKGFASRNLMTDFGSLLPVEVNDNPDYYRTVLGVYTAINVISQHISALRPMVGTEDSNRVFNEQTDRPQFSIFRKPNPWKTWGQFLNASLIHLLSTGETPWLLRDYSGFGKMIWPLVPLNFKVYGSSTQLYDHFGYVINGKEKRYEVDEILFIKFFDPKDELRGMSSIEAARDDINLDINVVTASQNIFDKGAIPSGLMSTNKVYGESAFQRFKEHVKDEHVGLDQFGKIMYLDGGWTFKPFSLPLKDLESIAQRKITFEHVATAFMVPPIFMGSFKETSRISNAAVQERLLWTNALKPIMDMFEGVITEFFLPLLVNTRSGFKFKFDVSDVSGLKEDPTIKSVRYDRAVKNGGATPNDYRTQVLGLPASTAKGMDDHYINGTPITQKGQDTTESVQLSTLENIKNTASKYLNPADIVSSAVAKVKQVTRNIVEEGKDYEKQDDLLSLLSIRRRIGGQFQKDLDKLFVRQLSEIVNSIKSQKDYVIKAIKIRISWVKWAKLFRELGVSYMERGIIEASTGYARPEALTVLVVTDKVVQTYLKERSVQYALWINETTRDSVDRIIQTGLKRGLTVNEIAALVNKEMKPQFISRAHKIARTETVSSTNYGRLETMKLNAFKFKKWNSQRDTDVRDEHKSLDGERRKVDDDFSNGIQFPNEPNCRCYLTNVKKL